MLGNCVYVHVIIIIIIITIKIIMLCFKAVTIAEERFHRRNLLYKS